MAAVERRVNQDYVTLAVFEEHQKHVDKRFDQLDARLDRMWELEQHHDHTDKVTWAAFLTVLLGVGGGIVALLEMLGRA